MQTDQSTDDQVSKYLSKWDPPPFRSEYSQLEAGNVLFQDLLYDAEVFHEVISAAT